MENKWKEKNAWAICQGHHGSGLGENMAGVVEEGPQEMYGSFDLQCTRTTLRTNYIKFHIDKTSESPMCRMCREKGESVSHLSSECSQLVQRE